MVGTPGQFGASHAAFRYVNGVGSASITLSRLYHAAYRPPVYASQPGAPATTQHSVPTGGQPFPGQDFHLLGRIEGFPSRRALYMASPFTKPRLAQ